MVRAQRRPSSTSAVPASPGSSWRTSNQPKLPKGRLQKNEWREDGNVNNLIGHRDAPNSASHYHRDEGFSKKDDKHGAYFKGIDTPGQHVPRDKKISSTCSSSDG